MNKKVIIGGIVLVALGVGGYVIYKKIQKAKRRKLFDEMVANYKNSDYDTFQKKMGSRKGQDITDEEFEWVWYLYQKLSEEDAIFMRDYFLKKESEHTQAEKDKFKVLSFKISKLVIPYYVDGEYQG